MPKQNKGPRLELNRFGVWEVRWTEDRRSRRVSTRTGDRQEAARFLAGFILEMERAAAPVKMLTGDVIDNYLRFHVEKIDSVVVDKVRQRVIGRNLKSYFAELAPEQITEERLEEYARLRAGGHVGNGRGRSPSTIRRELNMLKAAFKHAVNSKKLKAEDVPYIPLPQGAPPRDFWLTEEESDAFLEAADRFGSERGRLFVHIALATASRRRAIETLRWGQVDLRAGLIHFQADGRVQSKKRRVPVPISTRLRAVLEAVPKRPADGYVLGHPGSITRAIQHIGKKAAKAYGNPRFLKVTPHTLRHTWATQAARAGVPLWEIAGVLGDTLATVQKNYLHHCPDHLRNAINFREAA